MGKHRLEDVQAVEATTTAVVDVLKRTGNWGAVKATLTPEQRKGVSGAITRTRGRTGQ
jgi:hypothetical protein